MRTVDAQEAEAEFLTLLAEVEHGEEIVVLRGDVPVARITAIPKPPRVLGKYRGQFTIPEDFKDIPPEFDEYIRR